MRTHVKEALTTLGVFGILVAAVHAGIWFSLFGTPDLTVLNWPFHYFWFVVGAWVAIIVVFAGYNRLVKVFETEKEQLVDAAEGAADPTSVAVAETDGGEE